MRNKFFSNIQTGHSTVPELEIMTVIHPSNTKTHYSKRADPVQQPFLLAGTSLFHLRPKFSVTKTIYYNGNWVRELCWNLELKIYIRLVPKKWKYSESVLELRINYYTKCKNFLFKEFFKIIQNGWSHWHHIEILD